ncbi:MAG: FecR domain-containing protein [Candidatus Firestonebacteria bacterium]|nr:FecR domain-containing protein [Candidatus Firestonebacteria bacterium]
MINKYYLKNLMCVILLLFLSTPIFAATKLTGNVVLIKGDVKVIHTGSTDQYKVKLKDKIFEGDIIQTEMNSYVQIQFPLESIRIQEKSKFQVKKLSKEEKEKSFLLIFKQKVVEQNEGFELFMGKVYNKIKKLKRGEKSEIKTTASIFGVYGTSYELIIGDKQIELNVSDGIVTVNDVENPNSIISIKEGQKLITEVTPLKEGQQYQPTQMDIGDKEKIDNEIKDIMENEESILNETDLGANDRDPIDPGQGDSSGKPDDGSAKPNTGTIRLSW